MTSRVQFPVDTLSSPGGSTDLRSPGTSTDYRGIIPRTPERRTVLLPVPETRRARTRSNDFSRTNSGASISRPQSFAHRTVNPSPLGPSAARRRSVTHTTMRRSTKDRDESNEPFDPSNYDFGIPGLGDDYFTKVEGEYDNIDPKLAEDIKHALELKQKREARRASTKPPPPVPAPIIEHLPSPPSSVSSKALLVDSPLQGSPASSIHSAIEAPADGTRPATSNDNSIPATVGSDLSPSARERTKSLLGLFPRKRIKDKTITEDIRKLEEQFDEKVATIRANPRPRALAHAATTKDQIERHYAFYSRAAETGSLRPPHLLDVMRWRRAMTGPLNVPISAASAREAKSLDWLSHLSHLHNPSKTNATSDHVPWHLTALHLEEYYKLRQTLSTPQIQISQDDDSPVQSMQEILVPTPEPNFISLNSPFPSEKGQSPHSNRHSVDFLKSASPRAEGEGSRRSSLEGLVADGSRRFKRLSLSPREPPNLFRATNPSASPTPSTTHLLSGLFGAVRRKKQETSDDGERSNRNSISDESLLSGSRPTTPERKRILLTSLTSMSDDEARARVRSKRMGGLHHAKKSWQSLVISRKPLVFSDGESSPKALAPDGQRTARDYGGGFDPTTPRRMIKRPKSSALPTAKPFTSEERETLKKKLEHLEELRRIEYEKRERLLIETTHRNETAHRLLNSVGRLVREYARIQGLLARELNIDYLPLPTDLVDMLPDSSHRPRLIGWRAVEEAHARREMLGQSLNDFLATLGADPHRMDMHLPQRGVADAISELVQKLDEINQARTEVLKHQEHLAVQKKFADGSILRMKNVETRAESLILGSFPEASELHNLTSKVIKRNPTWVTVAQLISNPLEITASAILKLIATAVRMRRWMEEWRLWWIVSLPFAVVRLIARILWWMILLVLPAVRREVATGVAHVVVFGWLLWQWYH